MTIPELERARLYLSEAEMRNPGPWVAHSLHVAEAARIIAQAHPALNPESAYILGLLHDIGRREGITGMRHVYDGYRFMRKEGYLDAARICLTHSFPVQALEAGSSVWDCTDEEMVELRHALDALTYSDYDRLLQLCDALALPSGFCLLEKRFVDVLMRYKNYNTLTLPKWQAYLDIKAGFERQIGGSIYDLLPGIRENTFR